MKNSIEFISQDFYVKINGYFLKRSDITGSILESELNKLTRAQARECLDTVCYFFLRASTPQEQDTFRLFMRNIADRLELPI